MGKNRIEYLKNAFHSPVQGLLKIKDSDAFIYKKDPFFGVAIINENKIEVNEKFSNVILKSENLIRLESQQEENLIILISNLTSHIDEFSIFCMDFISSDNIEKIQKTPLEWWKKWKELIGNRLHNPKPYEIIAELHALYTLICIGEEQVNWSGPKGSTIDITTSNHFYEVKSSIIRYENEITISSQYQLDNKEKTQYLLYYKVERLDGGESIDSILNKISQKLTKENELVYNIESQLEQKGYPKYASSRRVEYIIHEIRKYEIDDNFPKITNKSFKDNKIPNNIKKIYYVINLDNLDYETWGTGD